MNSTTETTKAKFLIFRDISSPSLFAVHRVDAEGNRVRLLKDNLQYEAAQDLMMAMNEWKDFDVIAADED